jgi:adenosylcobinamide-phosphate synthase
MLQEIIILWLASILDYLLGDPWNWLHPVQVMGWIINHYKNFVIHYFRQRFARKIAGIFLGLFLILGSAFVTWLIIYFAQQINFYLAITIQIILLASCFAGRSLRQAAADVLQYLRADNIQKARYRLGFYVGRDTDKLTPEEIYRALLETVTENATDGVTAPLFYALLGLFIPVVGCVPMAIAYKASSTLDSMIGYKKEPYLDIGWFSAKVEDYLTWLPCRLTVLTLAIISGDAIEKIKLTQEYANKDPSPNSGWSESIYAVILGVQLGGVNTYQGEPKFKPLLGEPFYPIEEKTIDQALSLTRTCFLMWLSLVSTIIIWATFS